MMSQDQLAPMEGCVDIAPFRVDDLSFAAVLSRLETAVSTSQKYVAFALHVGGLLHAADREFVEAFNRAHCRYADGIASVLLARFAGARSVERTPTTDLAPAMFDRFSTGAPLRAALVGGPEGLAQRAGEALTRDFNVTVVHVSHGFHSDWTEILAQLRRARPQVILVGMGMPLEAKWVNRHLDELPACLVLTCGGWFGFVVGDERRAPGWLRASGFEWVARMAQDPARLAGRYARGAVRTGTLAAKLAFRRLR